MRVEILKSCRGSADGLTSTAYKPGDVAEVTDSIGRQWCKNANAKPSKKKVRTKVQADVDERREEAKAKQAAEDKAAKGGDENKGA